MLTLRKINDITSDSDLDDEPSPPKAKKQKKKDSRQPSKHATPVTHTPQPGLEGSDDDFESARQKQRRKYQNKNTSADYFLEARNPARRANKPATYNEADEDMTDEEDVAEWTFTDQTQPKGPSVGAVLDYRRIGHEDCRPFEKLDGDDPGKTPDRTNFEYLIRLDGKAHYSATWLKVPDILAMAGSKRLYYFYLKTVMVQWLYFNSADVSAEDKEAAAMQRIEELDKLQEHTVVERIVDEEQTEDGVSLYYIKWKGLNYDFCTWEDADFVRAKARPQVDRYYERIHAPMTSNKEQSNPVTRRQHKDPYFLAQKQPHFVKGGTMRDFQLKGLDFLATNWCKNENIILADEMGLGKTVQTVNFLNWLRHERQQNGPFLVVVPLSTMPAWADTFDLWAPDINYVVYQGSAKEARPIIRERELLEGGNPNRPKFNVLLTTFELVMADDHALSQIKWQYLAVDEAHRLKNAAGTLYACLRSFQTANRLLITGTPIQNNLSELRALMEFLNPGRDIVKDEIDYEANNASELLAALNSRIKPFILRRTKAQVATDLPEKKEKIIRLELSDLQMAYYRNIYSRNYEALTQASKGEKYSLNNIMVELKKASNHPFLFPGAEEHNLGENPTADEEMRGLVVSSGKMMLLDQLLPKLKRDGHRVLIFSQFVGMLDILGDYLHKRGHQFQRLDGNIGTGARNAAINHFNAPDSEDFAFLLSTRAGGLGINLATADTVIIFDSDWNPQADLQAMARAHRIGQKKPVTVFRLVSKDTIEEEILERARNKLMLEYITIQRNMDPDDMSKKINKAGLNLNIDAPSNSEDISRLLKKRGQKMFDKQSNQKGLEELDIDNVLANAEEHETKQAEGLGADGGDDFLKNFEVTDIKLEEAKEWSDIIPAEEREKAKKIEDEKRKKDLEKKAMKDNERNKRKPDADNQDYGKQETTSRAARKRVRAAEVERRYEEEEDDDPDRPLQKDEIKALIEAQLRWGYFSERKDKILKDAGLEGRNADMMEQCVLEVYDLAKSKLAEEQQRINALLDAGSTVLKKDQKSVLFDYKGAFSGKQLNAETVVQRTESLRVMKQAIDDWTKKGNPIQSFRVPNVQNIAKWTATWGPEEDGMLCVGVLRHGYNGWKEMEDDADLKLQGHMYLNEHHLGEMNARKDASGKVGAARTPGSVHLGRRVEYLCMVLRDARSNGTDAEAYAALQNYHRSNRRPGTTTAAAGRSLQNNRPMGSPAPGSSRSAELPSSNGLDRSKHHQRLPSGSGGRSQSPLVAPGKTNGYGSLKAAKRPLSGVDSPADRPQSKHQEIKRAGSNGESKATSSDKNHDLLPRAAQAFPRMMEQWQAIVGKTPDELRKKVVLVKEYVLILGTEIDEQTRIKGSDVKHSLWDHAAANLWFNKTKSGENLLSSYNKLLLDRREKDRKDASDTKEK